MREPFIDTLTIIGIGLIGSSIARAARENNLVQTIIGFDADPAVRRRARELGLVDITPETIRDAVSTSDMILFAVPVGAMGDLIPTITPFLRENSILTDVGSVKAAIADVANDLPDRVHFVPAHPVAGTERSGPDAGFSTLFQDRWVILTPLDRTAPAYQTAVKTVGDFWKGMGAAVETMGAEHHDLALAITSHLPHLIAFTLVGAADDLEAVTEAEIVKYSAGGFRDFTRIAASDPVMWRDVFLNNRQAVLEVLGRFTEELALLQRAIRWGDADKLTEVFTRGRAIRRAIVEAGQETDVPNFGRDQRPPGNER